MKVHKVVECVWFDWCDFIGIQIAADKINILETLMLYVAAKWIKHNKYNKDHICNRDNRRHMGTVVASNKHAHELKFDINVSELAAKIRMYVSKIIVIHHHKLIINKT